jgi:hypothetical protein
MDEPDPGFDDLDHEAYVPPPAGKNLPAAVPLDDSEIGEPPEWEEAPSPE